MPQMELVSLNNPSNVDVLNLVRGSIYGSDYQNRVPEATQANISEVMSAMWDYVPSRNEFINNLMNLVGLQILRTNSYTNPFGKYKRGMMTTGESIEEIAVGLLTAKHYNPDAEYLEKTLFGREPNNVQSRWHKIDRTDMYKLTVNQSILKRAFMSPNGLSQFVEQLMGSISTSDAFDEFEIMLNLFNQSYTEKAWFPVTVPDISTLDAGEDDAKQNLKVLRAWAERLPLKPSNKYNAARMPIVAQASELELFVTPNAKANLDVEGLAAAFNIDKANIQSRMTIIPEDDIKIPNFQWALSTREFFICADTYMDMAQVPNAAGRYTNFFHHHDGIYSASPFVPAIMGLSTPTPALTVIPYYVTGLTPVTLTDLSTQAAVTNGQVARGNGYLFAQQAVTENNGTAGPNYPVRLTLIGKLSQKTFINNDGILIIAQDDAADTITVRATSVDDPTQQQDTVLTVVGPLLYGGMGQSVDDNTAQISSTRQPILEPNHAKVGDTVTTDGGKWDTRGLTLAFQWQAGGVNVASNGTNSSYVVQSGDVGKPLTVNITATKTGKANGTATSTAITPTAN